VAGLVLPERDYTLVSRGCQLENAIFLWEMTALSKTVPFPDDIFLDRTETDRKTAESGEIGVK
jgi:hypothetical protein